MVESRIKTSSSAVRVILAGPDMDTSGNPPDGGPKKTRLMEPNQYEKAGDWLLPIPAIFESCLFAGYQLWQHGRGETRPVVISLEITLLTAALLMGLGT